MGKSCSGYSKKRKFCGNVYTTGQRKPANLDDTTQSSDPNPATSPIMPRVLSASGRKIGTSEPQTKSWKYRGRCKRFPFFYVNIVKYISNIAM